MFRTNRSNFVSNVKCLKLFNRKVVTYSQERIVDGWKAHSLIPVKRGVSSFDGNGLIDTALDGDIFLFVHQKSRAYGLRITSIAKY